MAAVEESGLVKKPIDVKTLNLTHPSKEPLLMQLYYSRHPLNKYELKLIEDINKVYAEHPLLLTSGSASDRVIDFFEKLKSDRSAIGNYTDYEEFPIYDSVTTQLNIPNTLHILNLRKTFGQSVGKALRYFKEHPEDKTIMHVYSRSKQRIWKVGAGIDEVVGGKRRSRRSRRRRHRRSH